MIDLENHENLCSILRNKLFILLHAYIPRLDNIICTMLATSHSGLSSLSDILDTNASFSFTWYCGRWCVQFVKRNHPDARKGIAAQITIVDHINDR